MHGERTLLNGRSGVPLQGEKILEQLLAGFGQNGFRMELHTFDFIAAVADAHDDAVIGFRGDLQFARK